MTEPKECRKCGTQLPPDAPGGHCPQCLLQLGLQTAQMPVIPILEKSGDWIGRYKLLQQIGEGGCGVVYMAEQDEPVRRRVALKIIKLGMDTKSVIARFEAERQALAMMDHPNIAKVFDAGATATGRPYFVMELVRGVKVTDYCDAQKLSVRQRLDLFIQVCQAIQHAHQKGIIHRDIKPSNVLVTEQDGMAVPKIIDFGIAKATTGERLTDKTLFTAFEQFIGTPAYMSPEQAGLGGLDIDTRSDIYSLGVLLYELLTGHQPFDSAELHRAALDEVLRTLREKEPPRPSARLTTLTEQELTLAAERHQTAPAKLSSQLRGDLDWIVMKALDKDRRRRYETANGFAADIQRHLKNEPVVARSPGVIYRFQKMVRRNKLVVAAVTSVALALIVGSVVSITEAVRATRAEQTKTRFFDEAEKARQQTEEARNSEAKLQQQAKSTRTNEVQLRAHIQVHSDISRAADLINQKNYRQAEELLNKIEPAYLAGDSTATFCRRTIAWDSVEKLNWDAAADELALLVRDDGPAWNSAVAVDHGAYVGTLLQTGRTEEYGRFRRSLLTRFATINDPGVSEFLCIIAMLTPADPEVAKAISEHYEVAKSQVRHSEEGSQWPEAQHRYALALTDYHRGNFQLAMPLCASALSLPQVANNFNSYGLALNALTHYQLNEQDDARMALTLCHQVVDPVIKGGPDAVSVTGFNRWWVWLMAIHLQHEADELMGAPNPSDYNRLADAKAKLETAEKFGTNPRFFDADRVACERAEQLAALTPAVLQRMEGAKFVKLITALGIWRLQHHEWNAAKTNLSLIVYGPSSRGSLLDGQALSRFYLSYAPLLVALDDREEYERFRTNAIATFGETSSLANASRTLEVCLLRPAGEKQMPALARLAALLITKPNGSNAPPDSDLTLALFKYRSGDLFGALELARTNLISAANNPILTARARILCALCLARDQKFKDAQAEINLVRKTIDSGFNSPPISRPTDLESWHEWWVDHALLLEADALIGVATTAPAIDANTRTDTAK